MENNPKTIEERKNHLRDIIKTIPHAVQAYEQLGTIYLEEGHTYLAVGAYNQALQLDPTNIHRYYYVSTAYIPMRQSLWRDRWIVYDSAYHL